MGVPGVDAKILVELADVFVSIFGMGVAVGDGEGDQPMALDVSGRELPKEPEVRLF